MQFLDNVCPPRDHGATQTFSKATAPELRDTEEPAKHNLHNDKQSSSSPRQNSGDNELLLNETEEVMTSVPRGTKAVSTPVPRGAESVSTLDDGNKSFREEQEHKKTHATTYQASEMDYNARYDWSSDDDVPEMLGDASCGYGFSRGYSQDIHVSKANFGDMSLSMEFLLDNLVVKVAFGDITEAGTDGIVNPADLYLTNSSAISQAIAMAAGSPYVTECRKVVTEHGHLEVGDVIHTRAGGTLRKKVASILHAVVPMWSEQYSDKVSHMLTVTYLNCIQHANFTLWMNSLTFPLLGSGMYVFMLLLFC